MDMARRDRDPDASRHGKFLQQSAFNTGSLPQYCPAAHWLVKALPAIRGKITALDPFPAGGDMEHMREVAFATVLRACGFGSLAIFCVMIGLSFEPRAAFQAGGFLTTLMARDPGVQGARSPTKNYRRTEMWLYLAEGPPAARSLCPMGELHGAARDLSHLREMDLRNRHCHVDPGAGIFFRGRVTAIPRHGQDGGTDHRTAMGRNTIARDGD